jgi:sortase A
MLRADELENIKHAKQAQYARYIGATILLTAFLALTFGRTLVAYLDCKIFPIPSDTAIEITQSQGEVTTSITKNTDVIFLDNTFGIYIPKIKTNAKVIPDVDPFDKSDYEKALQKGIAHAKGTAFPNQNGNVFLFAHSAVNFYEQRKYNIYFYLLNELNPGDPIYISYQNKIYNYTVLDTRIVEATETKYMGQYLDQDTLTLMSCWPLGTNWKRFIVTATKTTTD